MFYGDRPASIMTCYMCNFNSSCVHAIFKAFVNCAPLLCSCGTQMSQRRQDYFFFSNRKRLQVDDCILFQLEFFLLFYNSWREKPMATMHACTCSGTEGRSTRAGHMDPVLFHRNIHHDTWPSFDTSSVFTLVEVLHRKRKSVHETWGSRMSCEKLQTA